MSARVNGKKGKMKASDFVLVILTLILTIFGVIMVFSASYYNAISDYSDPYYYLKRDIIWAVVGAVGMFLLAGIPYKIYKKVALPGLVISLVLLLLLLTPLGIERNFATRWLGVEGFPITIMPGEVAKLAAIIFVAWYLSRDHTTIKSFTRGVVPLLLLCGVYAFLIGVISSNMSTAITVCGIIVGMMFVAGLSWFYLFGMMGAGVAGAVVLVISGGEYRLQRITSFLDPFADPLDTGYQVVQSLLALGSGGLFGLGLGKGIQKNLYLPEPQNDFILAIIGEELGFVGIILLMLCYLLLIWRCMHIAVNAADTFGMLLASGITIMLALQVILNIAVVTSSMPPTGIALPFVSYGGNALWLFMGGMGIMLNISRHSPR